MELPLPPFNLTPVQERCAAAATAEDDDDSDNDALHILRDINHIYHTYRDDIENAIDTYKVDTASELTWNDMSHHEETIYEADCSELKSFINNQAFKPRLVSTITESEWRRPIDAIWIRRWKPTSDGKRLCKSRLCARGCFDSQKHLVSRTSSTATRLSQKLLMSRCANNSAWTCESWDVSTAFLQGISFDDIPKFARALKMDIPLVDRYVYLTVPGNVWYHLLQLGFITREQYQQARLGRLVLQCVKCVYGLVDAPLLWAMALRYHMQVVMGGVSSTYDENTFIWRSPT
jgi:hypothetical protein